jgi:hypothetical protein
LAFGAQRSVFRVAFWPRFRLSYIVLVAQIELERELELVLGFPMNG